MSDNEISAFEAEKLTVQADFLHNLTKGDQNHLLFNENIDFDIECEKTAKQALSCTLQARKIKNQIEETRKEIVRPHIDFQKSIMKFSNDLKEKCEAIESRLHSKIEKWMDSQKENPFTCIDFLCVDDGTISYKEQYDFEVTDERIVPREFLEVDAQAIQKAIKFGVRQIEGVKIFKKTTTQLRVNNN